MIKLFTFAPDRLNLNGDQGNLLILSRRLEWAGVSHEIQELRSLQDLRAASSFIEKPGNLGFLLLGHGSIAAMRSLASQMTELEACLEIFAKAKAPVLVVGSCFEALRSKTNREARQSHFLECEVQTPIFKDIPEPDGVSEIRLFGYVNSQADLPTTAVEGSVVFTLLHGPVLAKSPELSAVILRYFGISEREDDRVKRLQFLVDKAKETALSLD